MYKNNGISELYQVKSNNYLDFIKHQCFPNSSYAKLINHIQSTSLFFENKQTVYYLLFIINLSHHEQAFSKHSGNYPSN